MSDTDFYEVIESQRAVFFKTKTVLIVVTDFRKLSEIVRKHVNSRTRRLLSEHILKLNTKSDTKVIDKISNYLKFASQTRN